MDEGMVRLKAWIERRVDRWWWEGNWLGDVGTGAGCAVASTLVGTHSTWPV